jgi:hypothetical protein
MEIDKLQALADFLGEQEIKLKKIISKESNDDAFTELCKPLMKYLAENHHPHTQIIVESNLAVMYEGLKSTGHINDYLVD